VKTESFREVLDMMKLMTPFSYTINGKDIELNPFVEEFIKNTVKGMISSLRGYEKGKIKIEVED